WTYFIIGQYDEGLINAKRAVSIDPTNVWAIANVANSYWKLGNIEEAEINFTKALKMTPNDPDILFDRGDFYRGINRDTEALRDYQAFFDSKDEKSTDVERIKEVQQWMASLNKESVDQIVHKKSISLPATPSGLHWAVIIGVSKYKDSRITPLRYASKDAQAFHDWLVSPTGGKYSPSQVSLLIDKDATYQNIREALFVWMNQALEEDVITFYFAGHGSSESPDSPDNLFFLPYDTQYNNIATTAFPMWDIETALKRFIKAKKVIVLADACHSGGVGQAFDIARRASRGMKKNTISAGFQNLSQIGDGVCVISASDEDQYSQEGQQWGGGHGIFTHTILEGLKGNADYNNDSLVTLGELIPYLSQTVRRETRNAQSPTVSGKFDPALSISR
ncbi:caspase family protein, partial [Candidatus Omnitrophota bacterium]